MGICQLCSRSSSGFTDVLRIGYSHKIHGFDFSHQGLLGIWEGFTPASTNLMERHPTLRSRPESPSIATLSLNSGLTPNTTRPPSVAPGAKRQSVTAYAYKEPAAPVPSLATARTQTNNAEFDIAVEILNDSRVKIRGRSYVGLGYPTISAKTHKAARRRLALALCEWDLSTEEFAMEIKT